MYFSASKGEKMEQENTDQELSTAERFAALSRVGAALMNEMDEVTSATPDCRHGM